MYGYFYEYRIKGHLNPIGIFGYAKLFVQGLYDLFKRQINWLFQEYSIVITKENEGVLVDHHNVFRYRVLIQFVIDVLFLWLIYNYGIGFNVNIWWPVDWLVYHLEFTCTLLGIFFVVKEFGYYIILGQLKLVKEYKGNPYWLHRLYFITGYFSFTYNRFKISFIIGCIIISIPYFINLINLFL